MFLFRPHGGKPGRFFGLADLHAKCRIGLQMLGLECPSEKAAHGVEKVAACAGVEARRSRPAVIVACVILRER